MEQGAELLPLAAIIVIPALAIAGVWLIQRYVEPDFDTSYVLRGAAVIISSFIVGLNLVLIPRQQMAHDLRTAVDTLIQLNPPASMVVGDYPSLKIYLYYQQGYTVDLELTEHMFTQYLTPESFDAGMAEHGELYVMGVYTQNVMEDHGITLDSYTLIPVDGNRALWLVRPADDV